VALSIKVKSEFYPEQVLKKSEFYRQKATGQQIALLASRFSDI
jgi:hypothetical protein